ncbi:conserved protein of unknown function [Candidatus Hydrogenisulfobacillus filiaventi]|uniref:Uncharacterized protein n=1 Tax=Candidatus Hydrogenisulfobacillus filiaventi TaxID=2707344 RepID=A0A6F8ZHA6_9FIRM|nr:hypothetical protein [Bacillota bacterium]CAB1129267.1 conserved protein of unknown function [Candidatus Hydrogenisulfobacillus filiaventi]
MEYTLSEIAAVDPALAQSLRNDIRAGRIPAERRMGVAGRPYVVPRDVLENAEEEAYRQLAARLASLGATGARPGRGGLPGDRRLADGDWLPWVDMVREQHLMLRTVVEALTQELSRQNQRWEEETRDLRELAYKLGQAHQEIARLERQVAAYALGTGGDAAGGHALAE